MDALVRARKLNSSHWDVIVTSILMIEVRASTGNYIVMRLSEQAVVRVLSLSQNSCDMRMGTRARLGNPIITSLTCEALWAEACRRNTHSSVQTVC